MAKSNHTPILVAKPTPSITPELARDARARAWAFVFQCWQEKGGPVTAPDDAEESKNDRTASTNIQDD